MQISVVILSKNEADRIGAAIASVPFAQEILVLDSGSQDGTVKLARDLGARVEEVDWPGFPQQRNRAMEMVACDWVLFLDADEVIDPNLRAALEALPEDPPERGFLLTRENIWLGHRVRAGSFGPKRMSRMAHRKHSTWVSEVHEILKVDGPTRGLPGRIVHQPYRSMREHVQSIDFYTGLFAEKTEKRARIWDVLLRPPLHFLRAYLFQGGFVDGVAGWMLAWLGAAYVALKWGRTWRKQRMPVE